MFVLAPLAGTAFAAVRGLNAWRTLRRFQRRLGASLAEVTRGLAEVESHVTRASESAARIARAQRRLEESLATASLLASAAGDARTALRLLGYLRR